MALIFFDWDDTFLPSTYLKSCNVTLGSDRSIIDQMITQLATLEQLVIETINKARNHGRVIIITNSETGWVELSAKAFLPNLGDLLDEITIVSSRSKYAQPGVQFTSEDQIRWKRLAMKEEYAGQDNILSVGDSIAEQLAVKSLPGKYVKSIKFEDHPNLYKLERQLQTMRDCMEVLISHEGHLDLEFKVAQEDVQPIPSLE